ncbi:rhodanese-like domain-containing protein [Ferrovibrio terrae]|uniref:rhodanese-like domain-containing protein n=1 Tax=Ferrovibrio terrae TaxID=2594003 RepID=UPI003137A918
MSTASTDIPSNTTPASVSAETVRDWLANGEALLIDVREPDEYADEHIEGAVLLPLSSLDAGQLPAANGKRHVLQCLTGKRSGIALQKLAEQGVTGLLHLDGGLLAYKKAGGATVEADEAVAA